jgi:signal transduction histidine kinase
VPVIFAGISPQNVAVSKPPPDVTGIVTSFDLDRTLTLAEKLQPAAQRLYVIAGSGFADKLWQRNAPKIIENRKRKFQTTYLFGLPYEQLVQEVSRIPTGSIVIFLTYFSDRSDRTFTPAEVARGLAPSIPAPVYAPYNTFMGTGVVGGFIEPFESTGIAIAEMALDILSGKDPASLPPRPNTHQEYRVDYRALQKFGLSERDLPSDTVVLFKKPSIWDEHSGTVLAALSVVGLQSALLAYLLIQRRRRKAAESEAEQKRQEVAHLMRVSVLGELSGAIAHEVNQPLAAILLNAQATLRMLDQSSPNLAEIHETVSDIVHENNRASDVIRRLRGLLKKGERMHEPVDINELVESTVLLLNSEMISRRITMRSDLAREMPPVDGDPVQLQQVLLNLIINGMDAMATIAAANRVLTVSTRMASSGAIEVVVKDRGRGVGDVESGRPFEPFFTTKEHGLGLGLTICSTIIQAHGGKLTLANSEDGGAIARFSLPAQTMMIAAQ